MVISKRLWGNKKDKARNLAYFKEYRDKSGYLLFTYSLFIKFIFFENLLMYTSFERMAFVVGTFLFLVEKSVHRGLKTGLKFEYSNLNCTFAKIDE